MAKAAWPTQASPLGALSANQCTVQHCFGGCRCGAKIGGGLGSSDQALDGILGFGQSNTSMLSQLASAGKVRKIFAHCLDTVNGGGIFAIGNIVQPRVKTTPLVPGMYVNFITGPCLPRSVPIFSSSPCRDILFNFVRFSFR
jgi:hypothetical protein